MWAWTSKPPYPFAVWLAGQEADQPAECAFFAAGSAPCLNTSDGKKERHKALQLLEVDKLQQSSYFLALTF